MEASFKCHFACEWDQLRLKNLMKLRVIFVKVYFNLILNIFQYIFSIISIHFQCFSFNFWLYLHTCPIMSNFVSCEIVQNSFKKCPKLPLKFPQNKAKILPQPSLISVLDSCMKKKQESRAFFFSNYSLI